ncbi:hypothetical protein FJT64_009202 [Amphibalanus amphitrite]|uniref:Uncharacterized protein n=1 Tax=Amphibalanus amphitrite TaxID=1232801 RepID=A0A6A4VMV8_AMPAM|nr:hypothetical protein FJT64_009202 [Amphibalanus amphitrite]
METSYIGQLKRDFFMSFLNLEPGAHTYTDGYEARAAMGHLLYDHSRLVSEMCGCYVCTIITAAYACQTHPWRFCSNQFDCELCYSLVGETMHILMPEYWPSWAKRSL